MPSSFINQPVEPLERVAHVTDIGVDATLLGLKIQFPQNGFMLDQHPVSSLVDVGFLKLDPDDDEDGPGYLIVESFPISISRIDQMYAVYLVLPHRSLGIIIPPAGMIFVIV